MSSESKTAPQITLKLLNGVSFWQNGSLLAELETQQPVWLLAYIALHGSVTENREEIGILFWPDKDTAAGTPEPAAVSACSQSSSQAVPASFRHAPPRTTTALPKP